MDGEHGGGVGSGPVAVAAMVVDAAVDESGGSDGRFREPEPF